MKAFARAWIVGDLSGAPVFADTADGLEATLDLLLTKKVFERGREKDPEKTIWPMKIMGPSAERLESELRRKDALVDGDPLRVFCDLDAWMERGYVRMALVGYDWIALDPKYAYHRAGFQLAGVVDNDPKIEETQRSKNSIVRLEIAVEGPKDARVFDAALLGDQAEWCMEQGVAVRGAAVGVSGRLDVKKGETHGVEWSEIRFEFPDVVFLDPAPSAKPDQPPAEREPRAERDRPAREERPREEPPARAREERPREEPRTREREERPPAEEPARERTREERPRREREPAPAAEGSFDDDDSDPFAEA